MKRLKTDSLLEQMNSAKGYPDTPETNSEFAPYLTSPWRPGLGGLVRLLTFARKLERERDQAREDLKAVRASIAEAEEYLDHTPICMKRGRSHAECDCGFDDVAKRFTWTQEEHGKEGA